MEGKRGGGLARQGMDAIYINNEKMPDINAICRPKNRNKVVRSAQTSVEGPLSPAESQSRIE